MDYLTKYFNCLIYFIGVIVSGLCPSKLMRKKIRMFFDIDKKHSTRALFIKHKQAGKIYMPLYTGCHLPPKEGFEIYNKYNERMQTFFLRGGYENMMDNIATSRYFIWDKYNFNLPVHFYLHNSMLETMGNPNKRYGLFIESESITPATYKIFEKNKGLEKDFDLIFTHTEKFLDKFENARLLPYCARLWCSLKDPSDKNNNPIKDWLELKHKNISIVSSNKKMCKLHYLRIDWANKCKQYGWADTFGNFDGGPCIPIEESLKNYRYSIAIENQIEPYWFTEKIVNCFATMTIPVYIGATKIDTFFNPDGIIQIQPKDYNNLETIINRCTKEFYEERINIILENYYKAFQFENINDYMYEKFLK